MRETSCGGFYKLIKEGLKVVSQPIGVKLASFWVQGADVCYVGLNIVEKGIVRVTGKIADLLVRGAYWPLGV